MNISARGLELIRSFEGYHRKLPDGGCVAYRCPAGVLTLGFGCTAGITEGMVWTHAEAEAALRREIAKFEGAVTRRVTAEISQNQFDALVSFTYNCGEGALAKSSVLSLTNAGEFAGAARAFALWNRGGGRVLPGLVSRRAREAALYLEPWEAPAAVPAMPQAVDPPAPTDAHYEAHDSLTGSSWWYWGKSQLGRILGGGAVGGSFALPHFHPRPIDIALILLGCALAGLIAIELLKLRQRNKLLGGRP